MEFIFSEKGLFGHEFPFLKIIHKIARENSSFGEGIATFIVPATILKNSLGFCHHLESKPAYGCSPMRLDQEIYKTILDR